MRTVINGDENIAFRNNADMCIGTGRLGLALTKEYLEQLREKRSENFKHYTDFYRETFAI